MTNFNYRNIVVHRADNWFHFETNGCMFSWWVSKADLSNFKKFLNSTPKNDLEYISIQSYGINDSPRMIRITFEVDVDNSTTPNTKNINLFCASGTNVSVVFFTESEFNDFVKWINVLEK